MNFRFLLASISLVFLIGTSSSASAYISGDFNTVYEDTTFSFGDGVHDLDIEWRNEGYLNILFGFNDYHADPGYSNAWIDNVGPSIDIDTFDAEPSDEWHDAFDTFASGDWIALKGINGYYGVLHITSVFTGSPGPSPNISGTWYFQDDGTSNFATSSVPIPGAVWLLGSGFIGLVGLRRKFKR